MEQATKQKAVSGMIWTGIERLGMQVIQFVIGILIARVLLPSDYGLIGMLAIFIGIAQTFLDSGFSNALIQKKNRTELDYSTVFYFSVVVGGVLYIILFFSAPLIAEFYNQPLLTPITRVYMLTLFINGLAIVQTAKLTIELNFRTQAIISLVSILVSGSIGIWMAYNNYGVWALVWQGIVMACMRTTFTWIGSKWIPLFAFSKESFHNLFSFGSKLLASSLINNIYTNISTMIIGKAFNAKDLGFFTRANQFCLLPTQTILSMVVKVNYPILAQLQDDDEKLVSAYQTLLRTPVFILYPVLFGLSVLAEPIIFVLIGEKWLPSASLIPILAFGCLWDLLTHINLNLLYVKGRSDLVLKLECIKKTIAFVLLFCSIPFGLKGMCFSISIYCFIAFVFNCYYTGKLLNYGFFSQIKSIIPIIGYCLLMVLVVYIVIQLFDSQLLKLIVGIISGIIIYLISAVVFKDQSYKQLLALIKYKLSHE